jgi:hypothetical protein
MEEHFVMANILNSKQSSPSKYSYNADYKQKNVSLVERGSYNGNYRHIFMTRGSAANYGRW